MRVFFKSTLLLFRVIALARACVKLAWTANFVRAAVEFAPMRDPADSTRKGENNGKHVCWNTNRFKNDT